MVRAQQNSDPKDTASPESPAHETPWHVLHVRSNAERRVAHALAVRAVEAYVPVYRERVKWSDRTVMTERPLFSGYVFTRFSPEFKLTVISTPGVLRSLGDEEKDLVSCSELNRIQTALVKGYPLRPHPHVAAGTRVKVRNGVFEGVLGTVTELRQQCKVVISMAAVRQCFSLEIDLKDLEVLT